MDDMVRNCVNLIFKVEFQQPAETVFSLQRDFFGALFPGLLALLLTLGCYKLLKKGWATYWVLLLLVEIGVIGGLAGII